MSLRFKRTVAKKVSAAAFAAAALFASSPANAQNSWVEGTTLQKALWVLPPIPDAVVDTTSFSNTTQAPYGYIDMCKTPEDRFLCERDAIVFNNPQPRRLSKQDWVDMHAALTEAFEGFKMVDDIVKFKREEKWTIARDRKGDCEDWANLFKIIMTTKYNWQEHELLMTTVLDENNKGHAVMSLRTDRGYLLADIKRNHFRPLEESNYIPVSMQTPENRTIWAALEGQKFFATIKAPPAIGEWKTSMSTSAPKAQGTKKLPAAMRGTIG
jgi:predicted transglutaminase-like cysteine proteinase